MKAQKTMTLTVILVVMGITNAGRTDADEGERGIVKANSADESLLPLNSLVVETDHGQGLGPNGEDLHYENTPLEPESEDAELFLQALEEPSPVPTDTPILEGAESTASAEGGESDTAVTSRP